MHPIFINISIEYKWDLVVQTGLNFTGLSCECYFQTKFYFGVWDTPEQERFHPMCLFGVASPDIYIFCYNSHS